MAAVCVVTKQKSVNQTMRRLPLEQNMRWLSSIP